MENIMNKALSSTILKEQIYLVIESDLKMQKEFSSFSERYNVEETSMNLIDYIVENVNLTQEEIIIDPEDGEVSDDILDDGEISINMNKYINDVDDSFEELKNKKYEKFLDIISRIKSSISEDNINRTPKAIQTLLILTKKKNSNENEYFDLKNNVLSKLKKDNNIDDMGMRQIDDIQSNVINDCKSNKKYFSEDYVQEDDYIGENIIENTDIILEEGNDEEILNNIFSM